jgi:hypothetical protein
MASSRTLISGPLIVLIFQLASAQAQQWQWAQRGFGKGSFDSVYGNGVAADGQGNVYVAGKFSGTSTFGDTNSALTSFGDSDAFLAKYNQQGQLLWAKQFGGAGTDEADSVAVDSAGKVYVAGGYGGSSKFDSITLTNVGGFIAKVDPTTTNVLWAKSAALEWFGVAVDTNSNAYVVGQPLPFQIAGTKAAEPIALAKYNSSGVRQWYTNSLGGFNTGGHGKAVAVDRVGNVYITGFFREVIQFGTVSLTNAASANNVYDEIFIAKFNTAGVPQWAKRGGGEGNDQGLGIGVDGAGNAFVTGYCDNTISLNGGTSMKFDIGGFVFPGATGGGLGNMFLAKFDTSGKGIWAKKLPGVSYGAGLDVLATGDFYAAGYFTSSPMDFGGVTLEKDAAVEEIFAVKYNGAGQAQSGRRTSSNQNGGFRHGMAISIGPDGAAYETGNHSGVFPVEFDGTVLGSTSSGVSMFVARLAAAAPGAPSVQAISLVGAGVIKLTVSGVEGQAYIIESSTTLANWSSVSTNLVTGGTIQFNDPSGTGALTRFYRLRLP